MLVGDYEMYASSQMKDDAYFVSMIGWNDAELAADAYLGVSSPVSKELFPLHNQANMEENMLKDIEFLFKIEKCPKLYIGDEGDLSDIIYYVMGYSTCLSELGMAKDWGHEFDAFVRDWYQDGDLRSISFWNRIQQHSNGKEDAIKQFYQILHRFCDENKFFVSESI